MVNNYLVSGEMTKNGITVNFSYKVQVKNEYMAAVLATKWLENSFNTGQIEIKVVDELEKD